MHIYIHAYATIQCQYITHQETLCALGNKTLKIQSQWTLSALTSQHKNGGVIVGTFVNFVWVTIGENFLSDHISAKKAGKELKPTGMVIR